MNFYFTFLLRFLILIILKFLTDINSHHLLHRHIICSNRFHPRLSLLKHHMNTNCSEEKSCNSTMSTSPVSLINKDLFRKNIGLLALNIPSKTCSIYLQTFKDHLVKLPKLRRIQEDPTDKARKLLILNQKYSGDISLATLPEELRNFNKDNGGRPQHFNLTLDYSYYSVEEVLKTLLPSSVESIPSSFEQVGHIAHLNLRDEALPYKYIIGQVMMDKATGIRTVVNKVGLIETEFRTFPMEVIAGESDFTVNLKESNAHFTFDFRDVYWNSRLQTEHARLIAIIEEEINRGDFKRGENIVVADMMAGVGPFAVPLAKHKNSISMVYANGQYYKLNRFSIILINQLITTRFKSSVLQVPNPKWEDE